MSKSASMMARREALLKEMGLAPLWKQRTQLPPPSQASPPPQDQMLQRGPQDGQPAPAIMESANRVAAVVGPDAGPAHTSAPGTLAPSASEAASLVTPPAAVAAAAVASERQARIMAMDWDALQASAARCQACDLCRERRQAVFGVGDTQADWLIVGEGPGAEEDQRGEPFVGQAGRLLDAMLAAIGLVRGRNVYIANAVKCRPPGNRTPTAEEMQACRPYLDRQIELLQPRLILALGRPAAQTLLQREIKIASARQRVFDYRGIPLVVSYHPAYLLRSLQEKAKAWEDLCFTRRQMQQLSEEGSEI